MFWFFKKTPPAKPTREQLLEQARKNAQAARTHIGEETLDRVAALLEQKMKAKQLTPLEQAKAQLAEVDKAKIADHLKYMMDEKK